MLEERARDTKLQVAGLPRLSDLKIWQMLAALALAFMNASWGLEVFRISGVLRGSPSDVTVLLFLVSSIFITYLLVIILTLLQLNERFKRVSAAAVLLILIAILPAIIYPGFLSGSSSRLERYVANLLQPNFFISPEFLTSLILVYFWRIGLDLSDHWIGPMAAERRLRLSMILMIGLGLVASSIGMKIPVAGVFMLLFAGLLAMGCSRISSVGYLRGGGKILFTPSFFASLSVSAAGLIAFVIVLTSAVGDPVARLVGRLASVIGTIVSWIVVTAFGPIFIVVLTLAERLLERLKPLTGSVEDDIAPAITDVQTMLQDAAEGTQPFPFADRLGDIIGKLIPVLVIAIIVLAIYFTLRRTRVARLWQNLNEEERKMMVGSIPEYLRALLRGGAGRGMEAFSRLMPVSRVIAAARVRRIYSQLLNQSADLGRQRAKSDTPLEFLPEMQVVFPGCRKELELITRAYLRVRYGEYPETREELDAVETAWQRVSKFGNPVPRIDSSL